MILHHLSEVFGVSGGEYYAHDDWVLHTEYPQKSRVFSGNVIYLFEWRHKNQNWFHKPWFTFI